MLKLNIGLIALFAALTLLPLALTKAQRAGRRANGVIQAQKPLTQNEQPMYFRLTQAFPEHIVLAQVAFSGLLTCRSTATRNTFDRKRADFVLCTRAFDVVAVIELDDSSHRGREHNDRKRDALLTRAGYKVLRYKQVPDTAKLIADVALLSGSPIKAT